MNIAGVKIKTDIKVSQAEPFLKKLARLDGLRLYIEKDFQRAWDKFRLILLICEQNKLQYWVNMDFRKACSIYDRSIEFRTDKQMYNILTYNN